MGGVKEVHYGIVQVVNNTEGLNSYLGLFTVSKESKLIAEYHIIRQNDGRLSSGESSIMFTRFDASSQSVKNSQRTSTVE